MIQIIPFTKVLKITLKLKNLSMPEPLPSQFIRGAQHHRVAAGTGMPGPNHWQADGPLLLFF